MILYYFPIDSEVYTSVSTFDSLEFEKKTEIKPNGKKEFGENERWELYLNFFSKQLMKNIDKYDKKNWEEQEDIRLVELRDKGLNWVEIS